MGWRIELVSFFIVALLGGDVALFQILNFVMQMKCIFPVAFAP